MSTPRLVPELAVSVIAVSRQFYLETLGFSLLYERPEEGFAYVELNGAQLMLDQLVERARLVNGTPGYPFGRGLNLQIEVDDVDALYRRVQEANARVFLPMEERWYRRDSQEVGNRQFVVSDPDGYLLRFFQDLGVRERT